MRHTEIYFGFIYLLIILILNRTKCPNTPEVAEIHVTHKMVFIKEESEDIKIEETFRVKHEGY